MNNINGTGIKRVALINDISCFGKCSVTVSLPILASYGIEGVPLPTVVLSTHTGGCGQARMCDMTDEMQAFSNHWKSLDIKFDCIYTGFFSRKEQIDIAKRFISDFATDDTLIIVDPVMGDDDKLFPNFNDEFVTSMRSLVSLADAITPNRTEGALLTGLPMDSSDKDVLAAFGNKDVVITSARNADRIGFLARMNGTEVRVDYPYANRKLHGAGDVFTSALCGELMSGTDDVQALQNAAEFCNECVCETLSRHNHWYGLAFEPVLRRHFI